MKNIYLKPFTTSHSKIPSHDVCQYSPNFTLQSYSGTLETLAGNCSNPSFSQQGSITFQPDPADSRNAFLVFPGGISFPITILDSEGHFEGYIEFSNPSIFGGTCVAQPEGNSFSGQVTPETLHFTWNQIFFNLTPVLNETCGLAGQTCTVPKEFNGTAV